MADEDEILSDEEEEELDFEDNPINKKHIQIITLDTDIINDTLSLHDLTAVIASRATMIEQGAPKFCDYSDLTNPIAIAEREIVRRVSPIKIRFIMNPLSHTNQKKYIYKKVNDMQIPRQYFDLMQS